MIRSDCYPNAESLAQFFAEKYRPTPMIAAWNKSGGVTDKIEVTIFAQAGDLSDFRECHESVLELGSRRTRICRVRVLSYSPSKINPLDA